MKRCLAAVLLVLCILPRCGAATVTAVTVENVSGKERPAAPATFGMIFAKGDVPDSVVVKGMETQTDVKRRWPDGSVKHAVLTVQLPQMAATEKQALNLMAAKARPPRISVDPRADAKDAGKLTAEFRIHGGPVVSISAKDLIESIPPVRSWLFGTLVREYHFKGVPRDAKGRPDPDLEVRLRVRCYPGVKAMRVAVVVENTKWTSPGGVPYDVTVRIGGKEVFARKQVGAWPAAEMGGRYATYRGHPRGTRWVKRFWIGPKLDAVHVRYDRTYLNKTGLVLRYDTKLKVPEKALAETAAWWAKSPTAILQRGLLVAYFGGTGGRPEIGPLPRWTTRYICSQDPRLKAVTLGSGDLSGSCPVHIRDPKNDWFISVDDYPEYSFNNAATRFRKKPRDTAGTPWIIAKGSYFSVDSAHQASLAYVPYLLSGDFYYLEEMGFWAARNMVQLNYAYRKRARAIITGQVRGVAWALRNHVHAAALYPDGSRGKAYFEAKLDSNLEYHKAHATAPDASPLGIFKWGARFAYTSGAAWRSMPRRYYSMAGWMHNFLAWAFGHIADHGYEKAKPTRDYLMTFSVGLAAHPKEISPYSSIAYFVFVGENPPEKGKPARWPKTWKELSELNYNSPTPSGKPRQPPTKMSWPLYGGSYSYITRGVAIEAIRAGLPKARVALKWLDANLPPRHKVMASDPSWAFEVPPEK